MLDLPRIATAMNASPDPRVLLTLGAEGVSLALWQRGLPDGLAAWLDGLPLEQLPRMRRTLPSAKVADAVRAACREAGATACADALAEEVATIARQATMALAAPMLEVRLSVSAGQPCPKWHVDAVPGRVLCTLRGPGTEFGPMDADGGAQSVHQMARGSVGAFRGALWPGAGLAGIVHRSPPATDGAPRLLLVIDPVDDLGAC
ncbi:DUF1826 domain-containing protein [Sagittula sp. NFXS13]|uniref:DUF1826 domain-containing protein n=1 Tax=Sagittula sp. NFXS13 TaxID=2819095 RepID=UPI0032DF527D